MGLFDYFRRVEMMSVEEVRDYMDRHPPEAYQLIDVRQRREYRASHIPGAMHIPLGELPERAREIDQEKPAIVYCSSGVRSRAAASILQRAGLQQAYSLDGGMSAWDGQLAAGYPGRHLDWFHESADLPLLLARATRMEEGMRQFYLQLQQWWPEKGTADLFAHFAGDELAHETLLQEAFRTAGGSGELPAVPDEAPFLEGGATLAEAVAWASGRPLGAVLQYLMAMEAGAWDRYLVLSRRPKAAKAAAILQTLARAEQSHLERLTALFEQQLAD